MRFHSLTGFAFTLCLLPSMALAEDCGGRLVRVSDGKTMPFTKVLAEAEKASLVAVGERHGLKEHTEAAACLLKNLDRKPGSKAQTALVVEHIASEKQPIIDNYRKEHPQDASGLGEALNWVRSGWPAWPVYEPLYAAAFKGGNGVYGSDQLKGIPAPSEADLTPRLGDDTKRVVSTWAAMMNEAHCGTLDAARSEQFGRAQAGRDLAMASVVQNVLGQGKRVLFYSGRGHGRKDVSVPFIVGKQANIVPLSISLQETSIGDKPVNRKQIRAEAKGRYDYIWFIGKAPQEDFCAVFRKNKKTGESK